MGLRVRRFVLNAAIVSVLAACGATASPAASTPPPGGAAGSSGAPPSVPSTSGNPVASVLPGGGNAGNGSRPGYPADPCSMLTLDQVNAVTALGADAGDSGGDVHQCDWAAKDGQVLANDNEGAGHCAPVASGSGITITAVSGIGDQACLIEASGFAPKLVFYRSGLGFGLTVTGSMPTDSIPVEEQALAKELLANLNL